MLRAIGNEAVTALLPILATLAVVTLSLSAPATGPAGQEPVAPPEASSTGDRGPTNGRLVVVLVDSWAMEDALRPKAMPRLQERFGSALHGPTRECVDGLTVPCLAAMFRGTDGYSPWAFVENLGQVSALSSDSILHELRRRGDRIGFIGDPFVGHHLRDLDWIGEPLDTAGLDAIDEGLRALTRERLDVVIIHWTDLDQTAHRYGTRGPRYDRALDRLDHALSRLWPRLNPGDHVAVVGDHGHAGDGHHFVAMDIPTYAAFWGPAFPRPLRQPMQLTELRSLFAAARGIATTAPAWFAAYRRGASVSPRPHVPPQERPASAPHPVVSLLCLLLTVTLVFPWRDLRSLHERRPAASHPGWRIAPWAAVFVSALWLVVAAHQSELWRWLQGPGSVLFIGDIIVAAFGLVAFAATRALQTRQHWMGAFSLGSAFFFAFPTLGNFGGPFVVGAILLLAFVTRSGVALARLRLREALLGLVASSVLTGAWCYLSENLLAAHYAAFWSPLSAGNVAGILLVAAAALVFTLRALPTRAARWTGLLAFGWGCTILSLTGRVPWLGPVACLVFAAAAPWAIRFPRLLPVAGATVIPAAWTAYHGDPEAVGPVLSAVLIFPLWALAIPTKAPRLERVLSITTLIWVACVAAFGARMSEMDFSYFFALTPTDTPVEATAPINGVASLSMWIGFPALGLAMAQQMAPAVFVGTGPWLVLLVRIKLSLTMLWMLVVHGTDRELGAYAWLDLVQETLFWLFLLAVFSVGARVRSGSIRLAKPLW